MAFLDEYITSLRMRKIRPSLPSALLVRNDPGAKPMDIDDFINSVTTSAIQAQPHP
jgi:hypothetical protein